MDQLPRRDADQRLAGCVSAQHAGEGGGRLLDPVDDVLVG